MGLGNNTTKMTILVVVVCCMVAAAPETEAAVSCSSVSFKLMPCLGYLMYGGFASMSCCSRVKALSAATTTKTDRRTVCECLKNTAASIGPFSYKYASNLPGLSIANLPSPISPNTNCSKF